MRTLSQRGKELSTVDSVNKWWCQGLSSKPELFSLKYITLYDHHAQH